MAMLERRLEMINCYSKLLKPSKSPYFTNPPYAFYYFYEGRTCYLFSTFYGNANIMDD